MAMEKKTAPVVGAEPVIISGSMQCSEAELHRHILRCLLNYHERMLLGGVICGKTKDHCKVNLIYDHYAEALKEAIRCIEIVHKDELLGG